MQLFFLLFSLCLVIMPSEKSIARGSTVTCLPSASQARFSFTRVREGFISHGIFQADPYPHACTKSVKGSIHISVERCRAWNIQCGHIELVVPKVQTPACLLGTKEPGKSTDPVSHLLQRLCLCNLKFLALIVPSLITNCHLPCLESTTAVSCVSHSKFCLLGKLVKMLFFRYWTLEGANAMGAEIVLAN